MNAGICYKKKLADKTMLIEIFFQQKGIYLLVKEYNYQFVFL